MKAIAKSGTNMQQWNDVSLLQHASKLAQEEKSITANLIEALAEIDRRKLYSELGHSSLFSFCVNELKLSEGQAYRRIQAARLVREIPEVKGKLENGDLSLSALSKMADHFKNEKTNTEIKKELLAKIENKSKREVEKLTLSLKNKGGQTTQGYEPKKDKIKAVSETKLQITLTIDEETLQLLNHIHGQHLQKNLVGLGDVIKLMCRQNINLQKQVEKLEKNLAKSLVKSQSSMPPNTHNSQEIAFPSKRLQSDPINPQTRHIPAPIRRQVFIRAHHACEFRLNFPLTVQSLADQNSSQDSNQNSYAARSASCAGQVNLRDYKINRRPVCGSKIGLEVDHIRPWARGGTHELSNLRLLCKAHHQRVTFKSFDG